MCGELQRMRYLPIETQPDYTALSLLLLPHSLRLRHSGPKRGRCDQREHESATRHALATRQLSVPA
jgi:hypothetical protein